MIREAIAALAEGRDLKPPEAAGAVEEILAGQATPAQMAGFPVPTEGNRWLALIGVVASSDKKEPTDADF